MKKTILLSLISLATLHSAQQVHVRYLKVLSSFATSHEDLYIKDNQVISIQDSIINKNDNAGEWMMSVQLDNGKKASKEYFVSDLNNEPERDFFFTSSVDTRELFIYDKVPKINWKIDESQIKTIAGYQCYKATGKFRGSNVIAYFTKELPYSTGPFKFFGLPGLILDVRAENKDHDIWKAESVKIDDQSKIAYKPKFLNKEKISLRDYIEAKEARMNKIFANISDKIPENLKTTVVNQQRFTVEQKFEWEK